MSGYQTLTRDDEIDVVGIFSVLKRKWWLVVLITLLSAAFFLVVLSMIPSRYESTARILVRDGDSTFTRVTSESTGLGYQPRFDEEAVRSEAEVLRSNNLVIEVIADLGLALLKEFEGDQNYYDVRSSIPAVTGMNEASGIKEQPAKPMPRRDQALRTFKERLNVYAIEKSRVIVVEFWSHDPELAQKIVTSLANKYISRKKNSDLQERKNASIWLDPRIKQLEEDVIRTEAAVAEFRANSDLLRTDNNDALLATQQLSQVSTELSRLKAQRSSAQAKVASIQAALKSGSSIDVIPEVIDSQLIQRLREREVALLAQASDFSTSLLPNHPRMIALQSQLKDFQSQIRTAAENIVTSLENNVDLARKLEADLESEIERLKAEASRVDEKLVELRALEREAEAAKELLLEYKSRSLEAKSRSGLSQVDAEIISPASFNDEAYFPKIIPFTIAGTAASFLLSVLGVIAFSLLSVVSGAARTRANTAAPEFQISEEDVKLRTKELPEAVAPTMADAPMAAAPTPEPIIQTDLPESEVFAVRFGADAISKLGEARVFVISPGEDLGSVASCLLARRLAVQGSSVVLMDLAGGAVCTRDTLGDEGLPGLFDLLRGTTPVHEVLYQDRFSEVSVVPCGLNPADVSGIDMELLPEFLDAIAEPFDYCIVDCGDVSAEEVNGIFDHKSIMALSCKGAEVEQLDALDADLRAFGYNEIIRLLPDRIDLAVERAAA